MNPVSALAALRAAIGVGAYVAPNVTGRALGLDPAGNPQASFLGRLFGVRDLALGAGTLSSEGPARTRWVQLGVACDLADAGAAYLAARNGTIPTFAGVLAGATALGAAGMGLAALRQS